MELGMVLELGWSVQKLSRVWFVIPKGSKWEMGSQSDLTPTHMNSSSRSYCTLPLKDSLNNQRRRRNKYYFGSKWLNENATNHRLGGLREEMIEDTILRLRFTAQLLLLSHQR
jgi:hypothetical protein